MEPAESLPEKPTLSEAERKGEQIVLEHHSMLTPSDFNFSVLRNPTQNFQFRGILWLTDRHLVYKGFFVTKMGATKVSEALMKPFCNIDTNQPVSITIPIDEVSDVFMGHDATFQKRFQRYPKLRIQFKSNGGVRAFYFYLTRDNLIDDELYINKRCKEWMDKIMELRSKKMGITPPPVPTPVKAGTPAAVPAVPKAKGIGTEGVLKEAVATVEGKRFGKIVVKPIEERPKPEFKALTTPVKVKDEEEEEPAYTKLLDTLIPVSDDEFTAAAADSSVSRCPHCGWILNYATSKCPRCRKEI